MRSWIYALSVLMFAVACSESGNQQQELAPLNSEQKETLSQFNVDLKDLQDALTDYSRFQKAQAINQKALQPRVISEKAKKAQIEIKSMVNSPKCVVTYTTDPEKVEDSNNYSSKLLVTDSEQKSCLLGLTTVYSIETKEHEEQGNKRQTQSTLKKQKFLLDPAASLFLVMDVVEFDYQIQTTSLRGIESRHVGVASFQRLTTSEGSFFSKRQQASVDLTLQLEERVSVLAKKGTRRTVTQTVTLRFPNFTAIGTMTAKQSPGEQKAIYHYSLNGEVIQGWEFQKYFNDNLTANLEGLISSKEILNGEFNPFADHLTSLESVEQSLLDLSLTE